MLVSMKIPKIPVEIIVFLLLGLAIAIMILSTIFIEK